MKDANPSTHRWELIQIEVSASVTYSELANEAAIALGLAGGQQGRPAAISLRYSRGGGGSRQMILFVIEKIGHGH